MTPNHERLLLGVARMLRAHLLASGATTSPKPMASTTCWRRSSATPTDLSRPITSAEQANPDEMSS